MKPLALVALLGCVVLVQPVVAGGIDDKFNQACATCHGAGALGAPKKGDKSAWAPRLGQGMPVLLAHVKSGFKNMPAKGLCNDCTDADFEALIQYMSQ